MSSGNLPVPGPPPLTHLRQEDDDNKEDDELGFPHAEGTIPNSLECTECNDATNVSQENNTEHQDAGVCTEASNINIDPDIISEQNTDQQHGIENTNASESFNLNTTAELAMRQDDDFQEYHSAIETFQDVLEQQDDIEDPDSSNTITDSEHNTEQQNGNQEVHNTTEIEQLGDIESPDSSNVIIDTSLTSEHNTKPQECGTQQHQQIIDPDRTWTHSEQQHDNLEYSSGVNNFDEEVVRKIDSELEDDEGQGVGDAAENTNTGYLLTHTTNETMNDHPDHPIETASVHENNIRKEIDELHETDETPDMMTNINGSQESAHNPDNDIYIDSETNNTGAEVLNPRNREQNVGSDQDDRNVRDMTNKKTEQENDYENLGGRESADFTAVDTSTTQQHQTADSYSKSTQNVKAVKSNKYGDSVPTLHTSDMQQTGDRMDATRFKHFNTAYNTMPSSFNSQTTRSCKTTDAVMRRATTLPSEVSPHKHTATRLEPTQELAGSVWKRSSSVLGGSIHNTSASRIRGGMITNPSLEAFRKQVRELMEKNNRVLHVEAIRKNREREGSLRAPMLDPGGIMFNPKLMSGSAFQSSDNVFTVPERAFKEPAAEVFQNELALGVEAPPKRKSSARSRRSSSILSALQQLKSVNSVQRDSVEPVGTTSALGHVSKFEGKVIRPIRVGAHSRAMQKARMKRSGNYDSTSHTPSQRSPNNRRGSSVRMLKLRSATKVAGALAKERKVAAQSRNKNRSDVRQRQSVLQLMQDDSSKYRKTRHDKERRSSATRRVSFGRRLSSESGGSSGFKRAKILGEFGGRTIVEEKNRTNSQNNRTDERKSSTVGAFAALVPSTLGVKTFLNSMGGGGVNNKVAPSRPRTWSGQHSNGNKSKTDSRLTFIYEQENSQPLKPKQTFKAVGWAVAAASKMARKDNRELELESSHFPQPISVPLPVHTHSPITNKTVNNSSAFLKRKGGPPPLIRRGTRKNLLISKHLDVREQKKLQGKSLKWIVLPDSTFRTRWDVGMLLLAMYYALSVPLRIAFQGTQEWIGVESVGEQTMETLFMLLFFFDIILNFRTAIKVKGEYITDATVIAKAYMRVWFIIDTIATLPVGDIITLTLHGDSSASSATVGQINKMLRLLRIFKVLRVFRVARILARLEEVIKNPAIIRLSKLLLAIVLVWHWVACLYWLVCDLENFGIMGERWSREQGNAWVPLPRIWCVEFEKCNETEWDLPGGMEERFGFNPFVGMHECFFGSIEMPIPDCPADLTRQYLYALFFAIMATTGIGDDIKPVTLTEHVVSSLLIVLGVGMLAVIFGAASSAISSVNAASSAWVEKYNKVDTFLKDNRVPWDLRKRITGYYSYKHARMQTEDKQEIFGMLHKKLDIELSTNLHTQRLSSVRMFKSLTREPSIMHDLITCMEPRIFIPQEFAFEQGDMGEDVFWIVDGNFAVYIDDISTPIATLNPGDVFGELALLFRQPRNATVRAVTHTDTVVLHRIQFQNVMCQVPRKLLVIMLDAKERGHVRRIAERSPWARLRILVRGTCQARIFGADITVAQTLMDPPKRVRVLSVDEKMDMKRPDANLQVNNAMAAFRTRKFNWGESSIALKKANNDDSIHSLIKENSKKGSLAIRSSIGDV